MRFAAEIRECNHDIGSVGDINLRMSGYDSSKNICGSDARASLDPNDTGRDFSRSPIYTDTSKSTVAYYYIPTYKTITIPNGQSEGEATWSTHADGTAGTESFTVMVTPLKPHMMNASTFAAYKYNWIHPDSPADGTFLSQPHWKASIDADPELTLRLAPGSSQTVTEGQQLNVEVISSTFNLPEISFNYHISDPNSDSNPQGFVASDNEGSKSTTIKQKFTLHVPTVDDSTDERDGTVTILLHPGTGYTVGTPNTIIFTVRDNDPGPLDGTGNSPPPPTTVSIGLAGGGLEGDPVSFSIGATPAPLQSPLPVNVTLSGAGGILNASDAGWRIVEIPPIGSYTLEVPTIDDGVTDVNNVTLTINPGAGYTPGQFASWTVDVQDAGTTSSLMQPPVYNKLTQAQNLTVVAIDPALVANVTAMAAQTQHGADHVDRWNRVLAAFGEIDHSNPMTAAEAQTNAEKYSSPLWPQIADVLTLLEAAAAEQDGPQTPPDVPTEPDAPPAIDPELVSKVRAQAAQTQHGDAHVDRWNRVLAAFGEIDHSNPMTAAEAQTNAEKYSSPLWPLIADALAARE